MVSMAVKPNVSYLDHVKYHEMWYLSIYNYFAWMFKMVAGSKLSMYAAVTIAEFCWRSPTGYKEWFR